MGCKIREHFLLDQNEKSKKIHLLLGLKNCGQMMEPVRAEQLNSIHPAQLPDIGIWRSPLTPRMMLTGRMGINKELVTQELPLLQIHEQDIREFNLMMAESKEVENKVNPFQINKADLEEIDDFLDEKEFYFCTQPK